MQRRPAADDTNIAMATMPVEREETGEREGEREVEVEVETSDLTMHRSLDLLGGSSFIIGGIIGSGIFISPGGVLAKTGSVALSLIVWVVSGVLALFGALSFAELGTLMGKSGAEYQYIREAFGNVIAYLYSWTFVVANRPAATAIIALTFSQYTVSIFGLCGTPQIPVKLVAAFILVTITLVNCYSSALATKVQIVFTVAKLCALGIIIVAGIVRLAQGYTSVLETGFEGTIGNPATVSLAFYSALWAYGGWNNLNVVVEELQQPEKNLPKANVLGVLVVIVVYVLTNLSYYTVFTTSELLASPAVAVTWGKEVLGAAFLLMPLSVMISTAGSVNGSIFTGSRLVYAAARHGNIPSAMSYIHCLYYTPVPSLLFRLALTLVMIIPGDVGTLINFFSFIRWIFFGLTFASVIIFRFRTKWKDAPRAYKVPLVIPMVMVVVSIYLVIAPIVDTPRIEFLYAIAFILGGLIFYIPLVHFKVNVKYCDQVTIFLQMILQAVPSKRDE